MPSFWSQVYRHLKQVGIAQNNKGAYGAAKLRLTSGGNAAAVARSAAKF